MTTKLTLAVKRLMHTYFHIYDINKTGCDIPFKNQSTAVLKQTKLSDKKKSPVYTKERYISITVKIITHEI